MTTKIYMEAQFTDNPDTSQIVRIYTDAALSVVQGAGWLNSAVSEGYVLSPKNQYLVAYNSGANVSFFNLAVSNSVYTLSLATNNIVGPSIVSTTVTSATPGTVRSLVGKIIETATTMTSGTIAGVRGEADLVSASAGFVYGVQGKVIPTGTLSGSVWAPAIFGQYDLSNATINAGQIAAVWGDMGTNGGTFTNVTGARMFAGTNTISSLTLNSMIYLYGKATNLLELSGSSSTYIATASSGALSGTIKKIAITIDGTTYYIPVATVVS